MDILVKTIVVRAWLGGSNDQLSRWDFWVTVQKRLGNTGVCVCVCVCSVAVSWWRARCSVVTSAHARTLLGNGSSKWWRSWNTSTSSSFTPSNRRFLRNYYSLYIYRMAQEIWHSFGRLSVFPRSYHDTVTRLVCHYHHSSLLSGHLWSLQ